LSSSGSDNVLPKTTHSNPKHIIYLIDTIRSHNVQVSFKCPQITLELKHDTHTHTHTRKGKHVYDQVLLIIKVVSDRV